jgi:PD-(D/E)XK nuclease superfamily protein
MKSAAEVFPNPKRRGEWAEMRFMARAAEEGFRVSKPWGESGRYDFAVEDKGRFLRIQVKSTMHRHGDGFLCHVQPLVGFSPRYTSDQVDFFAAYVIPEDVWYILPAEVAVRLVARIKLSPRVKGERHECYKEAWHLLHEAIAKKDAVSVPQLDASAEGDASLPEPVADPAAEPGEIPLLRGAVEPAPAVGFDPDLLRSRMAGCFERMRKRQ